MTRKCIDDIRRCRGANKCSCDHAQDGQVNDVSPAIAVSQVAKYEATKEDTEHEERLDETGLVGLFTHQVPLATICHVHHETVIFTIV